MTIYWIMEHISNALGVGLERSKYLLFHVTTFLKYEIMYFLAYIMAY